MNRCRRCSVETDYFHVLRLGGTAGENQCRAAGIQGHYNPAHDTYNVTLCALCREDVMLALEKCFKEGSV